MVERLQKLMARAGCGSRRACEEFIAAGRVRVNGELAALGGKADAATDVVTLDGRRLGLPQKPTYIALYKPRNVISSVDDPAGRKTVRGLVPESGHLYPVGRLDWDSEGLVLMTNDGELTNLLTHPRYGHTKEYRVLVARRPDSKQLETWRRGVVLEDGHKTASAGIEIEGGAGKGAWLRITMGEGRKRQIREIGALLGLPIVRIVRTRIRTLRLGTMKPGEWRHLSDVEIRALKGKEMPGPSAPTVARRTAGSRQRQDASAKAGGQSAKRRPRVR
jgi:23S rRNA pseudouridine2605 synthase